MSSGMCEGRCRGLSSDAYAMGHLFAVNLALLLRPSNDIYAAAALCQSIQPERGSDSGPAC